LPLIQYMFIDTHTHIYLEHFTEDIDQVIQRCLDEDIQKLYMPNIDSSHIDAVKDLARKFPDVCIPMMGLHPCSVKDNYEAELEIIKRELDENIYAAVGEIGIDLYWDKSTQDIQEIAFRSQILWAKEKALPIVIHSRDSLDLTISIVEEMQTGLAGGIFHCFNGTVEQAKRIAQIPNFFIGIGGVITFKNAGVDKVVEQLPLHMMVLETDAPYLSPVPFRGKRNESAYLSYTAKKLAELMNVSVSEIAKVTTENSNKIFPF